MRPKLLMLLCSGMSEKGETFLGTKFYYLPVKAAPGKLLYGISVIKKSFRDLETLINKDMRR